MRTHTDVQNPLFEQAALADFIHSHRFERHIRQMRKLYGQRRQALLSALKEQFGNTQHSWGDAAGLHMAVEFQSRYFGKDFIQKCKKSGISLQCVDYHCIQKGMHTDKLLLGYGHLEPEEIKEGIRELSKIF